MQSISAASSRHRCRHLLRMISDHRKVYVSSRHVHQTVIERTLPFELHKPVMVNEVMDNLRPLRGQTIVDMTFGAGGHTRKILESVPDVNVITLDRDPECHQLAHNLQHEYPNQITPLLGKFSELPVLLTQIDIRPGTIDAILFDFGCSSMQFDSDVRGFSVSKATAPLDMRMDANRCPDQPTAADILAKIDEIDLVRILKVYGGEKNAKKIARAIVDIRYAYRKLETTRELTDVVAAAFPEEARRTDKLNRPTHLATKTFQAIRILVNDELNEINYGMVLADKLLKCGTGRLVTLSFHSLEDTIVKRHLAGNIIDGAQANALPLRYSNHTIVEDNEIVMQKLVESNWQQLHKHVVTPTAEEVEMNARSRSAKLRAAIKIK